MKTDHLTLLPKAFSYREALIGKLPNILPRLILRLFEGFGRQKTYFSKVALATLLIFYFLGYQPALAFPPVKHSNVKAEEAQSQTVSASIVPEFSLPHLGYISTSYSWYHPGLDIATSFDTAIHPIAEGIVEEVNLGYLGYGNHVIVSHGGGYKSLYGHMNKISVQKFQNITPSDTLGTVGLTGFTSGPHTHLEISKDGQTLNPKDLLPEIGNQPLAEYLPGKLLQNVIQSPSPSPTTEKLAKSLKLDI